MPLANGRRQELRRGQHTLLSFLADKLKSVLPGPMLTASMSASPLKLHVLVIARLSGCWVTTAEGVMQSTLWYLPRQVNLEHKKRPTQSGGICGSWFLRSTASRWSTAAILRPPAYPYKPAARNPYAKQLSLFAVLQLL